MLCPNCGTAHEGQFCNQCGQSNVELQVPLKDLLREAAEEAFGLDSRLRHTVLPFFFRPGELTRDYLGGRRVRYTSPLKLYLAASLIFFFAFAHRPNQSADTAAPRVGDSLVSGFFHGADPDHPIVRPALPKAHNRLGRFIEKQFEHIEAMGSANAARDITAFFLDALPKVSIALLPFFAWMLRIFWPRRYYAEHLVFTLHYNAFTLLLYAPLIVIPSPAGRVLNLIGVGVSQIYLFVALRTVNGGGMLITLLKLIGFYTLYSGLLLTALLILSMASMIAI